MKNQAMASRFRFIGLVLTLVLVVGAITTSPAAAYSEEPQAAAWICEDGCWSWDIENGCTQETTCCANGSTGDWFCILW
ncbi:MAG TPA: hypothetical protein VGF69_06865 [Thermoanaerobaculia bacterium]|jgi:hypothetical protein